MSKNPMSSIGLATLAWVAASSLHPSDSLAQGSLTPPGPPGPTMKTLAQIEPRTPIASAPFIVSAPGSYYLTSHLTVTTGDAITIAADGVTLDLNGFTISSTAPTATGYGILIWSNRADITIFNGHLRGGVTNTGGVYTGPGFAHGIAFSGAGPENIRITGVSVSGCLANGIRLGRHLSATVESCTVRSVGDLGIEAATIRTSAAIQCGGDAISGDQVADSRGQSVFGDGIHADSAMNCTGASEIGHGIYAETALNCQGTSRDGVGIFAGVALNCIGSSVGGDGIYALKATQNCSGTSEGLGRGIYSEGSADNSHGTTVTGTGLEAGTAQNSSGASTSDTTRGEGLSVRWTALNCRGYSAGFGNGIFSGGGAENCYGESSQWDGVSVTTIAMNCSGVSHGSGNGLYSYGNALNCSGLSALGDGLYAEQVAQNCHGDGGPGETGVTAQIANSCAGGGSGVLFNVLAAHSYNMP